MKNGIFQISWSSLGDAALMAILTAIAVGAFNIVTTTGFDVFSANWTIIGKNMVNLAVIAGVVSFAQDFLSTKSGSILNIGAPSTFNG